MLINTYVFSTYSEIHIGSLKISEIFQVNSFIIDFVHSDQIDIGIECRVMIRDNNHNY